jgi:hypothetical protein
MAEWVIKMQQKDADSLGAVRCIDDLLVAVEGAYIWLKGSGAVTLPGSRLQQLPVLHTYQADENNLLFIPGGLTPVGVLKELQWQPLREFIKVQPPVAAMSGVLQHTIRVQLVVSGRQQKGKALLTSLLHWKQYAEAAPLSRLAALQFAVAENGDVLITGHPLPPLPGKEYWETNDILVPAGYDFETGLLPSFIDKKFNAGKDAILVFDTKGNWQRIDKSCFVEGKRSAVRLTKLNHD